MRYFRPKDKGKVKMLEWLTRVYADEVFKAIEAKKKKD